MASVLIHMTIANEINKVIKKDSKKFLFGSIAPDLAKYINIPRSVTHFTNDDTDIPNLTLFENNYSYYFDDDFVLGYYVHLYTDYLWFKYFLPDYIKGNRFYNKNGELIEVTEDELLQIIYNDYTNLELDLVDKYDLDLSILYEDMIPVPHIIREIPESKMKSLQDQVSLFLENAEEKPGILFDINDINKFIKISSDKILDILNKKYNIK